MENFIFVQFFSHFSKLIRSEGEGGGKPKADIYCFDDVILLLKSVQEGEKVLDTTKFDRRCLWRVSY